jgi:restriction system protein
MNFGELRKTLDWLNQEDALVAPSHAVSVMGGILQQLLSREGFDGFTPHDQPDRGFDFDASSSSKDTGAIKNVGILYKHLGKGRLIGVESVNELIRSSASTKRDRVMFISRSGFTKAALETAHKGEPVWIQLLDLFDLDRWIARVESIRSVVAEEFHFLIRSISHEFATRVAKDPAMLDHLEWRDLERMMERVMQGLGFNVTLIPPSKDGGKDLILSCTASRGENRLLSS